MKKIFTLAIIALTYVTAMQAQTITINKTDGSTIVLQASEINNIVFEPAELTEAQKIAGTYTGKDSINVGGTMPYYADAAADYVITANEDSTINITLPEESISNTAVGNLEIGSFTISNIAWDSNAQAFVRNYSKDGIKLHFKSTSMRMDSDYALDSDKCEIKVKNNGNGTVTITNTYQMGRMPFPIYSAVVPTKK
jgi:hypothetical protein